mgnify:CR=1 FL=1|tara:strand:+ start:661 stop:933 length:273 start_codon:yes stop_codon:yes gene_type:complete
MRQLLTKREYKKFQKAEETLTELVWQIEKRLGGELWNLVGDNILEESENTDVGELLTNLSNINITIQDNDIKDLVGKKLLKQDLETIKNQ